MVDLRGAKPKVVITNWVHDEVLEYLASHFVLDANVSRAPWPREEVRRRVADAWGMMAFMTDHVDEAFLASAPRLKAISCALKGFDNFDVAACSRRGVDLTFVPDLLTAPTAELAIGLMIGLGRQILPADRSIREDGFEGWRPRFYGRGLDGSVVGLVGMGAVGQAIAARLQGFGATVHYFDPRFAEEAGDPLFGATFASLDALIAIADYVVLATPLTQETLGIFGADRLARMKPGAFLINPARGSLVDEAAVAEAIASGHLAGYAADVFECEDWARAGRPDEIEPRIRRDRERTLLTPHIGSAVDEVRRAIAMAAASSLVKLHEGEEPCRGDGAQVSRVERAVDE